MRSAFTTTIDIYDTSGVLWTPGALYSANLDAHLVDDQIMYPPDLTPTYHTKYFTCSTFVPAYMKVVWNSPNLEAWIATSWYIAEPTGGPVNWMIVGVKEIVWGGSTYYRYYVRPIGWPL